MIAFGTTVAEPEPYHRYAEPGISLAAEPDSERIVLAATGSVPRCNNLLLEAAARRDDLEALVLVHPHAEITAPDLCARVREALSDPDVAIVGCVGATGVTSIAWWEGSVSAGTITHQYVERGGGRLPGFEWARPEAPLGEVDAVAGFLLVLSPWAVRNLRFDESLRPGYGYDVDLCFQARQAGRKVVAADLPVIYHHALQLVGNLDVWIHAHMQFAEKWEPEELDEEHWKERARRAEAEREAERALGHSRMLLADALVEERKQALDAALESLPWRLTAPLRRLNHARKELKQKRSRR
jgi:Glycosyltransferase like family